MSPPQAAESIRYVVEGGHRLSGSIEPSGNKNAALPIVAAALLTEQPVHLANVPRIRDIETLVELDPVGRRAGDGRRATRSRSTRRRAARHRPRSRRCARKIRASILLAGPLLARCGEIELPPPGGDVIGRRRVDTHFLALRAARRDASARRQRIDSPRRRPRGRRRLPRRAERHRDRERLVRRGRRRRRRRRCCATPPASRTCRISRISSSRSAREIEGIGTNTITIHGGRHARRMRARDRPGSHRGRLVHRARRRDALGDHASSDAGVEHLRSTLMGFERLGDRLPRSRATTSSSRPSSATGSRSDLGGARPEARGSALAGVPGRYDVDRDRHRDAVRGR